MIKNSLKFLVFSLALAFMSCVKENKVTLQNGDLLFVGDDGKSELSAAIDRVTRFPSDNHFTHVGLVEVQGDSVWVMDSAPKTGTSRRPLQAFLEGEKADSVQVIAYRLKPEYQSAIPNAIEVAKTYLGKAYNFSYILNDTTMYCTELVQRAFSKNSIFDLTTLTFINPKTGKVDDFWEKFYDDQKLAVPEGAPGTKPNLMAESEKLEKIGRITLKDVK